MEPFADGGWVPLRWEAIVIIIMITLILFLHAQQVESTTRLDFIWKIQVSILFIAGSTLHCKLTE